MPAAVEENAPGNGATASAAENNANDEDKEQKPDRNQQRWNVLKAYILRDRARQRQEREAEVEEERLRKEREAREQQEVMTLLETREQIIQLEARLQAQLQKIKEEKHQLFLQLKKVLNEDDNRRRQLQKDASLRKEREAREQQDVMTLGKTREQIIQLEARQQAQLQKIEEEKHQLFLQLKKVLNEDDNRRRQLQKDASEQQMVQIQSLQQQGLVTHQPQTLYIQQPPPRRFQTVAAPYKTGVKRPISPSPPPQVPVSLYHQGYTTYKPPTVAGASYQNSPQKDDGRRNEFARAAFCVLKAPQYSSQPSAFYPVAPQDISIYYPGMSREAVRPVYDQQRPQGFPMEHKMPEHYGALRTATQHGHVIHPGPGLAINPAQAPPKGGSITAGYPVRSQPQYQQAAPASLYTAQSRQMYQNYPTQRE